MTQSFSLLNNGDRINVAISAVVSAIAGWGFTGQWGYTIIAAALGTIVSALPRIIVALTGSRKSASEIMQRELVVLSRKLSDERDVVRLVRISKHNLLSELQKFSYHIDYLEETLKHHKVKHETMPRTPMQNLIGFEDRGMAEIVKQDRDLE